MPRNFNDRVMSIDFVMAHSGPTVRTCEFTIAKLTALHSVGIEVSPTAADDALIEQTARQLVGLRVSLLGEAARLPQYDKTTKQYDEWVANLEIFVSQYRLAQAFYLLRNYDACRLQCDYLCAQVMAMRPLIAGELPVPAAQSAISQAA